MISDLLLTFSSFCRTLLVGLVEDRSVPLGKNGVTCVVALGVVVVSAACCMKSNEEDFLSIIMISVVRFCF